MGKLSRPLDLITPEAARTLDGLFRLRVEHSPAAEAYRQFDPASNTWQSRTWAQMAREVARWQAALAGEGLEPGARVALMLANCREWVCFEQAALGLGLVVVPLYVNDRPDNVAFILRDAGVRVLLCDGPEHWAALAPCLGEIEGLARILTLRPCPDGTHDPRYRHVADWLPETGGTLQASDAEPDALATLCYTSGTTGRPKGVMLSHRNLLSNAYGGVRAVPVRPDDLFLSFLPLSHMLERTAGHYIPMMAGATVAYARSVQQLGEDLQTVRPTALISVPRIYERVHAKILGQLAEKGPLARTLFEQAVAVGWQRFEHAQGRAPRHPRLLLWPLLDALVAGKIMAKLGGRLRVAVCGGAPLPMAVARTFIGLGLNLVQGYGLTETSPVLSVNRVERNDPRTVGEALPDIELRIGPDNELQARGPCVMLGYWNNPQATAEVIDADGWLHTGDQARIDDGCISIVGRLKEILVLSNGEKIPPADMEMAIAMDPLFEQVLVIGEGRPYLSVLATLDAELWQQLAGQRGLDPAKLQGKQIEQLILERIGAQLRDFPGYAQVRRAAVFLEPWTVENGLITPTLKLRRTQILERFADSVERLYQGH